MRLFIFVLPVFVVCHWNRLQANPMNIKTSDVNVFAQPHTKVDSLISALKTPTDPDTRFKLMGEISWAYIHAHQLEKATQYADSIRLFAEKLKSTERIAYSHFYYGVIARHQGNLPQALNHLDQFVSYYEAVGDSSRVASGYFQISAVNSSLGNYDKSLAASYRILNIYEDKNDLFSVGFTLNSIGIIQRHMKKYEDAIDTYEKALSIYEKLDAQEDKANVLGNLANVYSDLGRFNEAKDCFRQALHIDETLGNQKWIAYDLENIGNMYNKMEKCDSALAFQLRALAIRETLPNRIEHATTSLQVAQTYFNLEDYTKARQYALWSFAQADEARPKPLLRDINFLLAKVYFEEKDFQKAYKSHQLYALFKDSVLNEETSRQLNELQTKYETEKKDKQITLLAAEKEVQEKETARQATLKNSFVGGLAAAVLIGGLLVYGLRQKLRNQKLIAAKNDEIREVNFKSQMIELELKALRAQINPHFLFNCMNSINRIILNGETDNASRYLTKFSRLIRLILENSEEKTVPLENELEMLESYIQLEALRFKGRIQYKIVVDEGIDPETTFIPSMVLQPFVENAIWHGLMHKGDEQNGHLAIFIKEDGYKLMCTIEDNGVGRAQAKVLQEKSVSKSKSLGMKLTEERLRLLSKERLEQLIRITDLKDARDFALGTRVEVNLPIS